MKRGKREADASDHVPMSNHRDSQQQQQQQQHAHNDTHSNAPHTNPVKSRWLNWVEEQNRKNAQRASKPDNIVVSKVAGAAISDVRRRIVDAYS